MTKNAVNNFMLFFVDKVKYNVYNITVQYYSILFHNIELKILSKGCTF